MSLSGQKPPRFGGQAFQRNASPFAGGRPQVQLPPQTDPKNAPSFNSTPATEWNGAPVIAPAVAPMQPSALPSFSAQTGVPVATPVQPSLAPATSLTSAQQSVMNALLQQKAPDTIRNTMPISPSYSGST